MAKTSIIVTIKDKEIQNKKAVRAFFISLPDGKYLLEADNSKGRTNNQNRFYWGVCVKMVKDGLKEMGHSVSTEETHDFLKARFNYEEVVNTNTGEIVSIPKSTSGLKTIEFIEYIAKIQQFAAEWLHVIIPDPGQQMQMEYDNNETIIQ